MRNSWLLKLKLNSTKELQFNDIQWCPALSTSTAVMLFDLLSISLQPNSQFSPYCSICAEVFNPISMQMCSQVILWCNLCAPEKENTGPDACPPFAWVAEVGLLCLAGFWLSQLNHLMVSRSPREQVQASRCEFTQFNIAHSVSSVRSYAHCKSQSGSQIWRWHWIAMLVAWGYHGSPLLMFNQTLYNAEYGARPLSE